MSSNDVRRAVGGLAVLTAVVASFEVMVIGMTGCGGQGGKAAVWGTANNSVTIYPTSTTVGAGESLPVVTVAPTGGVNWSLSGTGCSGSACGALTAATASSVTYVAPAPLSGNTLPVVLKATSVSDPGVSSTVTLTVVPTVVTIPALTSPAVPSGASVNLTASVSDDLNYEGVTWSLAGSGCSGATCGTLTNATTTSVTYTAPQSSGLEVSIIATSVAVPSASAAVAVSVPEFSSAIKFSPSVLANAIAGQPYTATVTASGGTAPYAFEETSLPSWLTVTSTSSNSITLSGVPPTATAGTSSIQLTAIDSSTPQSFAGISNVPLTTFPDAGAGNGLLTGSYAFWGIGWQDGVAGQNTASLEPRIAYIGSFTADGSGNITGGEMDINSSNGLTSYKNLTGSYAIGANQLGMITLVVPYNPTGAPLTLVVGLNGITNGVASQGSFSEYDDSTGIGAQLTGVSSGIRMSGSLALQSATALNATPLNGNSYAFGMAGRNPSSLQAASMTACQNTTAKSGSTYYGCGDVSLAGALTLDSNGSITGGEEDVNQAEEMDASITLNANGSVSGQYDGINNSGETDASGRTTAYIGITSTAANDYISSGFPNAGWYWPSDFIIYVVNPQTFYVMSSDSYASTTLVAGEGMQQDLADLSSAPFTKSEPIILYSQVLSTQNFPSPNGNTRTELQLINVSPTNSTSGSMSGTQFVNAQGTYTNDGAIASYNYSISAYGRVHPSSDGEPAMYLVDTNRGFATNAGGNTTNPEAAGVFLVQPQTGTTLNAGTYVMSTAINNSETAPSETGVLVIPTGGVTATATNVATSGYVYASYSEGSTDQSNAAQSLLFNEAVTGTISNSGGVIPSAGMTLSSGIQACASGGGYVISPTMFACISGTGGYAQVYIFQQ